MKALLLAGLTVLMGAGSAHATSIGDTIQGTLSFGPNGARGGQSFASPTIVAPGTFTYTDPANTDSAAFSDGTTFTITDVVTNESNGFGMTFKDLTNAFTSVKLVSSTFSPGLTSSIANGVISVGWTGTTVNNTYTAVFSVGNTAVTPEPSSLVLLGMGMAGIAAVRRRWVG